MADPSLGTNFPITCNPLKNEEEMVVEEPILRPRPPFGNLPTFEAMDSKHKELILTLPKERWGDYDLLIRYQNFWLPEKHFPGILAMQKAFKPRSDDVIVVSLPKSGTTWLKALAFTIVHRNKYAFSCHPLLKLNPHDCIPFIEHCYSSRDEHYLETLPSPRVLGTHVQYLLLPESIITSKCPILYICREPKDVLVSLWHMYIKMRVLIAEPFSFTQAFELFCQGISIHGPFWDHVLQYYTMSLQSPHKILFLKYEEMMKDPIDGAMRIANFIGCPFSEEEVKNGVVQEVVKFCSFNKLKDLDVNKYGIGEVKNDHFFRKAIVGDWQNHMTAEMAIKLDKITKEKLLDFGFTY